MVIRGTGKQQGSTCASRAKVKMHNLGFISIRFHPLMGSMGLRGWSKMLALPAVTPAQHIIVPWVMQIGKRVLYHPSAVCNNISHTSCFSFSGIFVQQICVVHSFSIHSCLLYVSESFSRSLVNTETTGMLWAVVWPAPPLIAEGRWGVAVCPWPLCQVQMKLSTRSGFFSSELKRALGLAARHLQLCGFNVVDNFILTWCWTTWMNGINLSATDCALMLHYYHVQTCRWERSLWLHFTVMVLCLCQLWLSDLLPCGLQRLRIVSLQACIIGFPTGLYTKPFTYAHTTKSTVCNYSLFLDG